MTTAAVSKVKTGTTVLSARADALARRLEEGVRALIAFARDLTPEQWQSRVPHDGRKIGVVVHHVANIFPLEIQLAQQIADGQPVTGVTWDVVHKVNAGHAEEFDAVTKPVALNLLERNGIAAAAAIRALSDEQLDRATTNSLYADAPLTCQFFVEDHALRHSYHHLAKIRAALNA